MTDTIYLVSWPRSGSTLLRAILWQCFGIESSSMHGERRLWTPEHHALTGATKEPCRVIKTHNYVSDLPKNAKRIYVVRDGREACVSFWHYYRDILNDRNIALRDIIRGNCMFGSWCEHVEDALDVEGVDVLRYEDLQVRDGRLPRSAIDRLAKLVGVLPYQRAIAPWETFHRTDPQFFRSGTNMSWHKDMGNDDRKLFDDLHRETMQKVRQLQEGVDYALTTTA